MSLSTLLPHRGASRRRLSLLPRLPRLCVLAASLACAGGTLLAQNTSTSPTGDAMDDRRSRRGQYSAKGGTTPEDIQERLLGRLREQMGVTDDDEWKVIADRIAKVAELRRETMGGFTATQARFSKNGTTKGGRGSSPELEMLRQAIMDNLPDAEIKARLMRLQEVRKMNDERLRQAQEDLRSILTVRQEAIVVLYGLIP